MEDFVEIGMLEEDTAAMDTVQVLLTHVHLNHDVPDYVAG